MHNLFHRNGDTDVLLFGLDTGRLKREFSVGDLKLIPNFDLRTYLKGYDEVDIGFIVDNAKYGQFRPQPQSKSLLLSPMIDDTCLIPFKLYKAGWISAMAIAPVEKICGIETRCELDINQHLFDQILAYPGTYTITKNEIDLIQERHQQLQDVPEGYLEMAIRRFSRSYRYMQHSEYAGASELDDYWVDLVIALESITTRGSKEGITRNMARRTALLLGKSKTEQEEIKNKVRDIYKQRCDIVHGNEKNVIEDSTHDKRFVEAEALRGLVRNTINACIELLINASTSFVTSSGHRKTLAEIIDERLASTN